MGRIKNSFTYNEIEILTLIFRDYILEQEVLYPSGVPKSYYKILNRLAEMRDIKDELNK